MRDISSGREWRIREEFQVKSNQGSSNGHKIWTSRVSHRLSFTVCSAPSRFRIKHPESLLLLSLFFNGDGLPHPSRREIQALCKKNKIPANMTNLAMANALAALQQVFLCFPLFSLASSYWLVKNDACNISGMQSLGYCPLQLAEFFSCKPISCIVIRLCSTHPLEDVSINNRRWVNRLGKGLIRQGSVSFKSPISSLASDFPFIDLSCALPFHSRMN